MQQKKSVILLQTPSGEFQSQEMTTPKQSKIEKTTKQKIIKKNEHSEQNLTKLTQQNKQNHILKPKKKTIKQRFFWSFSIYIGGLFPCISFNIAHSQIKQVQTYSNKFWLLCLITLFLQLASAPNVAKFMKRYWEPYKAWCFVLGCELSMSFTEGFTAYSSLLIMIGINAIMLVEAMNNYKD
jgi:hypothetical protein